MWWLLLIPAGLIGYSLINIPSARRDYCKMPLAKREKAVRGGWGSDYWKMSRKARLKKYPMNDGCGGKK